MNELQQVLLIFSVVVIAGLYFLSRSRKVVKKSPEKTRDPASNEAKSTTEQKTASVVEGTPHQKQAAQALKDLGNPHIPVSEATEARFNRDESTEAGEIDENQGKLSFGQEFELPEVHENGADKAPHIDTQEGSGAKHHVLVVDDPGMVDEEYHYVAPDHEKPKFGIPDEASLKTGSERVSAHRQQKEEVYVIMVMSTASEFKMVELNHALRGVGLQLSEQNIYVKKDNMGNVIIKVANLLEPGIFPIENLEEYATPGIAMILELPSTVKAPNVMHDLIMMARKISQRMEGRLYNMERQLIKESDLQSMRDAAVEYESEPL
ncbi:MAG: cell division-like protein [Gammaproteobacteria bacterium]|nr:cell division-like protein [Gammaproteobacteria bacterium]